jgi:hypothetical protein
LALVEEEPERAPVEAEDEGEVVEGKLREEKSSALLVARLPAAGKLPMENAGTELLFFEEELCPVCEAAPAAPALDFVGVDGGGAGVVGVDGSWCVLWKFKSAPRAIKTEFLAYVGGAAAVVFGVVIGFCVFLFTVVVGLPFPPPPPPPPLG